MQIEMASQFKPIIIDDPLMKVSANAEGIQFEPSPLIKAVFGPVLMTDQYYRREKKSTKQTREKCTKREGAKP